MGSGKTTKELVAQSISQPNAFDNSKGTMDKQKSSSIFYKNKGYLSFNCKYWHGTTKKSFRQWEHPKNIIQGKKSRCGTTEKHYGSHNEIQHIGSPAGDIPRPAMLHIYNFKKSFLNQNSEIDHLKITFSYRVVNVTDGGRIWDKNLSNSDLAVINGFKAWFGSWDQSVKLSAVQSQSTKLKYEGKNKKGYIWKTITLTFKDITAADIFNKNFAFNLQFGMNCSKASTPCFIYISNFKINITYNNAKKYIEGSNSINTIYTSTDEGCYLTTTQTIEAGYKSGKTKISPSQAPEKLGKKIKLYKAPKNVSVTPIGSPTDLRAQFQIIDKTNIPGEKSVIYCLKDDTSTKVKVTYKAIQRARPEFNIEKKYKLNEDFDSTKSYISFKNGCASSIKIYIDDISSTPLTLPVANQHSIKNLLDQSAIETFHSHVKNLSCGYHTLYIQRGNESLDDARNNKVTIQILPMEFKFKIEPEDTITYPDLHSFKQRKKGSDEYPNTATLKIQRIDDEPCEAIPSLSVIDDTNRSGVTTHLLNMEKGGIEYYDIDLYYAGTFNIQIVEDNNPCALQNSSKTQITIESTHKQNYDYLFTRGQDGTGFDFDYLVAWEGDNVKTPISISDITLNNSIEDIRICSDSKNTGLSQIGLIELVVSNLNETETFQNIHIELNTLIKNDDNILEVTTNEWTSERGIFNNFYNLFYKYNTNDNITIENLTPDGDLIDEENVYLNIKNLPAKEKTTIYLPYYSTIEKTVFLQYLLFEQPQKIYYIGSCDGIQIDNLPTEIQISVADSMQTQLSITGNTDLLNMDPSYECPDECYSTIDIINDPIYNADTSTDLINQQSGGITYTITNIDTNDFANQKISTEIINSNEIEPYGYYLNDTYYDINQPIIKSTNQYIKLESSNDIYNFVLYDNSQESLDINGTLTLLGKQKNIVIMQILTSNDINLVEQKLYIYNNNETIDENLLYKLYERDINNDRVNWTQEVEQLPSKKLTNQLIHAHIQFPSYNKQILTEKTDTNGIAKFFIQIPPELNKSYTIKELLNEVLYFKFDGTDGYNPITLSEPDNTLIEYTTPDQNKNYTQMKYTNNYYKYKPGEIAYIPVLLSGEVKTMINKIQFNAILGDTGSSDQITVLYRICNIKDNQGIFKTTFQTTPNETLLIPQQISKDIYCGIDTNTNIYAKLEKQIVEKENLNILYLSITNQQKINNNVYIEVDLGRQLPEYLGNYSFINIETDIGDYAIKETEDGNIIITWLLGEMQEHQKNKAIIKIQADRIGVSDIKVKSFDYLHQKDYNVEIQQNQCKKCNQQSTYIIKNTPWKQFTEEIDGVEHNVWYKLINGNYYRRVLQDGELIWVMKQ